MSIVCMMGLFFFSDRNNYKLVLVYEFDIQLNKICINQSNLCHQRSIRVSG